MISMYECGGPGKMEGLTGAAAAASREVMPQATNSIEDNVCGPEGNNESS
jgi:hypothetical protein